MKPQSVSLEDGRTVLLRQRTRKDAEGLYNLFSSLSEDAKRWTMAPITRQRIERWLSQEEQVIAIVAVSDEKIIGQSVVFMYGHHRYKNCAELGIQVHQDFQGVGLGTVMTERCIRLAEEAGIHRLSLEVVAENHVAIHLYQKLGFQEEGRKREAFFGDDGNYHDMVMMGQILDR